MGRRRDPLLRHVAGGLVIAAVAFLTACADRPAPAYLRLDAEAPRVADAPAARALLVVFWASWCPPCRTEAPSLRKLAENPPGNFAVVVFGHDESPADVRRFFGGEPPAAWRFRADADRAAARAFGVDALPSSTLIVDGRAKARFAGPRDWDAREMRRLLERLIAEGAAARR